VEGVDVDLYCQHGFMFGKQQNEPRVNLNWDWCSYLAISAGVAYGK